MAGDNPTLATANEATGVEPLNSGPKEPQVPKQEAQNTSDQAPAPFGSLPHGYRPIVLPLHVGNTASVQTASSLPGPHGFEDLLKATLNPSGPARAEELSLSSIKDTNVVDLVMEAVGGADVKVYKLETGLHKSEIYVMGLDPGNERIIGVQLPSGDL